MKHSMKVNTRYGVICHMEVDHVTFQAIWDATDSRERVISRGDVSIQLTRDTLEDIKEYYEMTHPARSRFDKILAGLQEGNDYEIRITQEGGPFVEAVDHRPQTSELICENCMWQGSLLELDPHITAPLHDLPSSERRVEAIFSRCPSCGSDAVRATNGPDYVKDFRTLVTLYIPSYMWSGSDHR